MERWRSVHLHQHKLMFFPNPQKLFPNPFLDPKIHKNYSQIPKLTDHYNLHRNLQSQLSIHKFPSGAIPYYKQTNRIGSLHRSRSSPIRYHLLSLSPRQSPSTTAVPRIRSSRVYRCYLLRVAEPPSPQPSPTPCH